MDTEKEIAIQTRCIYCHQEQYGPAVMAVSRGLVPCAWCARIPPVLTEDEYREKLREKQDHE